jgi:hypothetical protein
MNIFLYNRSETFRKKAGFFSVALPVNHPEIESSSSIPSLSDEMCRWIRDHCENDVYVSTYEPIYINGNDIAFQFVVDIWFSDVNEAVLFKLTWSGQ